MENLRKSFEIFCTPNTQSQISKLSQGTKGHNNYQRNPEKEDFDHPKNNFLGGVRGGSAAAPPILENATGQIGRNRQHFKR